MVAGSFSLRNHQLIVAAKRYQRVDYRPQNAYVKSKDYMAVDSENPRMYQCSRVFAFRGFDLRFSKPLSEAVNIDF